jgi:kynurenine formamidase
VSGVNAQQWNRWGENDEIGRFNLNDRAAVLDVLRIPQQGSVWALGQRFFGDADLPNYPERPTPLHMIYRDWSHYLAGRHHEQAGGGASVDDGFLLSCHGGTHVDALGHAISDGVLWGGTDATETFGGLRRCDVAAMGAHGLICRAVLVDLVGWRGNGPLPRHEHIRLSDVLACLEWQGAELARGDMLLLRTGSVERYHSEGSHKFFADYSEPGLSDEPELISWIDEIDLIGIGTDSLANELPRSPLTGLEFQLHRHLLRDRGLQFHEALWLADLAADCAVDRAYAGLYLASPLKMVGASGSPINPLFVK